MYNSVFSVYKSVFLQESVPSKSFKEKLKLSIIKVQENKINKMSQRYHTFDIKDICWGRKSGSYKSTDMLKGRNHEKVKKFSEKKLNL